MKYLLFSEHDPLLDIRILCGNLGSLNSTNIPLSPILIQF